MDLTLLKAKNTERWSRAAISADRKLEVMLVAKRLVAHKDRYSAVEAKTGVPWFIVACLHEREASGSFSTQLGQGDPLNRVSVHDPRGRGPFPTWEDGAYDALVLCPPFASRNKDWSVGGALTLAEQYNGLGPEDVHHIPSSYVWGATNIEEHGKYVSDHNWSASTWDTQLGVAAITLGMMALDPTIRFGGASYVPQPAPPDVAPTQPAPQSQGPLVSFLQFVLSLLKGK